MGRKKNKNMGKRKRQASTEADETQQQQQQQSAAATTTKMLVPNETKPVKQSNKRQRKNRGGGGGGGGGRRRRRHHSKRERFWIEDCIETFDTANQLVQRQREKQQQPPDDANGDNNNEPTNEELTLIELLITRSDLVDDYRPPSQSDTVVVTGSNETVQAAENDDDHNKSNKNEDGNNKPTNIVTNEKSNDDMKMVEGATVDNVKDKGETEPKYTTETEPKETCSSPSNVVAVNQGSTDNDRKEQQSGAPTLPSTTDIIPKKNGNTNKVFVSVKRANSAKKPMVVSDGSVENFRPLPNGDCGDGILNPYPKDEVNDKFWAQRRRLFTRYDDGIQLDKESWYSVTPEAIARHIAGHLVANHISSRDDQETNDDDNDDNNKNKGRHGVIVLDAFCGCGGNAIQFALQDEVSLVVCVDNDRSKLEKAALNASIYNVPTTKMVFIHDHAFKVLSCYDDRRLKSTVSSSSSTAKSESESSSKPSLSSNPSSQLENTVKSDEPNHVGSNTTPATTAGYLVGGIERLPGRIDCIFLSPPWGGMDYGNVGKRNYTLQCIQLDPVDDGNDSNSKNKSKLDGDDILIESGRALGCAGPIALFLPRNTNGAALGRSVVKAGYGGPVVMEQNVLNGKLKTVTAYIGLH